MKPLLSCGLAALTLLSVTGLQVTRADDVPIEGDSELLKLSQSSVDRSFRAIAAKRRLIADTELTYNNRDGKSPPAKWASHVHHLWEGKNSHVKFSQEEPQASAPWEGEFILTEKRHIWHSPLSNLVQITEKPTFGVADVTQVHPKEAWFRFGQFASFSDILNPKVKPELLSKFVIRKEGEQITAQRHYKAGGYYAVVVSLDRGGNVTSYDTVEEEGHRHFLWRGRLDWAELPGGQWYLKSCRYERSFFGTEKIHSTFSMTVTDYEPNPKIPANSFSMESIPIPRGTKVEEYGPSGTLDRTYNLGGQ